MVKNSPALEFTGERLIPEVNTGAVFFYEHLSRYLLAAQLAKGKTILDAGCGTGYGSQILAKLGRAKKVFGVDISPETIEYANSKYWTKGIVFTVDDVLNLQTITGESIDMIVSFEVLEHLINPEQFMAEMKRVLKPGGVFIVSTPNKLTHPAGNPFHFKEFSPEEFYDLLKTYFNHVHVYHQYFEFAQVFKEEQKINFSLEEKFSLVNRPTYTPPLNPTSSMFLLAVCGNKTLPKLDKISLTSTQADDFNLSKGFFSLHNQFSDLRGQVQLLQSQLAQEQSQKNQLLQEISGLNGQLQQIPPLQDQKNQLLQEISGLNGQLQEMNLSNLLIKSGLEEKNQQIFKLKRRLEAIKKTRSRKIVDLIIRNNDIKVQIEQTRTHVINLEQTLQMIKSAKFFKLWQTYCTLRKLFI